MAVEKIDAYHKEEELKFTEEVNRVVTHVTAEATESDLKRLRNMLIQHKKVFTTASDELGCCTDFECAIRMKDNIPVAQKPYRYSLSDRVFINKQVEEWKAKGIARDSTSEYASPVVLVRRDSSESTPTRLCIDYRKINEKICCENYPMQNIDDILDSLMEDEPQYFNVMDIKTAFLTIKMRAGDEKYTSFVTQDAQFELNRMPFGLNIAPRIMQRAVDTTYRPIKHTKTYIDDVCQGEKTVSGCLDLLEQALIKTEERGLKMSLKKCQLVRKSISYLGYVLDGNGKIPDPQRTAAIDKFTDFSDKKQVKRFLAFGSHYRKFMQNYSAIVKPINDLLKKDVVFNWTEKCQKGVEQVKQMLKNPPILAHFRHGRITEIHADASLSGFGGVLIQLDENNKERVIEYASRRVSDSELNLHSNDLECCNVHWLITHRFRIYVYGLDMFWVVTDNWTVAHLNAKKTINRKYARWIIELQEFSFKVRHKKGSLNVVPDLDNSKRRQYVMQMNDEECVAILDVLQRDPRTKTEKKLHEQYSVIEEVLCSNAEINGNTKRRIVIPIKMQDMVLELVHDKSGHGDFKRTFAKLSARWFWNGYRNHTKQYVESCDVCQRMNSRTTQAEGRMTARKIPQFPFEVVSVDHFGPLETVDGYKYVIVLVDHSTRYVIGKAQKSTKTAEFIRFMEEDVVTKFGSPFTLISDRGTCFTSREAKNYFMKKGIVHQTSPAYFPEANGLAERAVRTLKNMLRKFMDGRLNWKRELNRVVFNINTSINASSGVSPFELLFGFEPRIEEEHVVGTVVEEMGRMKQLAALKCLRNKAMESMEAAQVRQAEYYNEKRPEASFKVGDNVLYTTGSRRTTFDELYDGPFIVVKKIGERIYELQRKLEDGSIDVKTSPAEKLKVYKQRTNDSIEASIGNLFNEENDESDEMRRGARSEDTSICSVADCKDSEIVRRRNALHVSHVKF
ncbi:pol polyprotein-like protein [Leptotrombidium deliense]|uniref:RNA-directed DNA polymerase n=1 Tax=Leptotrombidium deliense TaxID=299467 RepID=A0A443SAN2_9ACAR|nr:pol polyprotein-like protein [Leptotrombidium deliense]